MVFLQSLLRHGPPQLHAQTQSWPSQESLRQAANSLFCLHHNWFANWTPGFGVLLQLTKSRTPVLITLSV